MKRRASTSLRVPFLLTLLAGCESSPSGPNANEPLAVVRLRQDPASLSYSSGLTQPQQLVVRDQAAWREVWQSIWATQSPQPSLPEVDFSREMIVVAALGVRPTGGYSIFVDGASAGRNGIEVQIRSVSPGTGCGVTLALTQPVDVARLPRREGRVTFAERHVTQECR